MPCHAWAGVGCRGGESGDQRTLIEIYIVMSTSVWTWKGKYFGYISNNNLYTYRGKHVGKFSGDNVFDRYGKYIGEIMSNNRLITSRHKRNLRGSSFTPSNGGSRGRYANYSGYAMYAGYEDFPLPEEFE